MEQPLGKDEIRIELSGNKGFGWFVRAVIGIGMGYFLFHMSNADVTSSIGFFSPSFVHGLGLLIMIMIASMFIGICIKMSKGAPGVILDSEGLTDNASFLSAGFIPWANISGAEAFETKGQPVLFIVLKEPEKYIAKCNSVKRFFLRTSMAVGPSPVGIPVAILAIDMTHLIELVNRYLQAYVSVVKKSSDT